MNNIGKTESIIIMYGKKIIIIIIIRIRQIKITTTSIRNKDQIKSFQSLGEIIPQNL